MNNAQLLEIFSVAFATFFATVGPVDVAAVFAALTNKMTAKQRMRTILKSTFLAYMILLLFAIFGRAVLQSFGVSLAALQAAGGVLLLLIGIEMVFARSSGASSTTEAEEDEAKSREDIAIFPLATPLLAGPGTIGAIILLMAEGEGDYIHQSIVIAAITIIMILTIILMFLAAQIQRVLGVTGAHVVSRIMGILLTALAMQFIFNGVQSAGLFG